MRTIKFRAWVPQTKTMKEVYGITPYKVSFSDVPTSSELIEVGCSLLECVLMQFTGLLDKNGKEIYEGDIISDGEWKQRVYATEGGFAVKSLFWSGDFSDLKLGDELVLEPLSDPQTISYIKQNCEVIGNIYES